MTEESVKKIVDACQAAGHLQELFPALPKGVTPRGVRVLEQIDGRMARGQKVCVSEISEMLDVTRPGITSVLRELDNLGYVEKERDADDSRVIYVRLTEKGRELVNTYVHGYHRHLGQVLGALGDERAEQLAQDIRFILESVRRDTETLDTSSLTDC